jgi:long-chain acyl-CoA synthetase
MNWDEMKRHADGSKGLRPAGGSIPYGDALSAFRSAVAEARNRAAVQYFDGGLTYGQLDEQSDVLAAYLRDRGVIAGDRLAIFLQNVPQFIIALIAAWKADLIPVPINPMNKEREISLILEDCSPRAAIAHPEFFRMVKGETPEVLIATSAREYQTRNDPRAFKGDDCSFPPGVERLQEIVKQSVGGLSPQERSGNPDGVAFLVYTSGTTGVPKGVMNSHRGAMLNALAVKQLMKLESGDAILGLAPLFHISGLVMQVLIALLCKAPIVLSFRFESGVMIDSIREYRPAMATGPLTAYIAMMDNPTTTREDFSSFKLVSSGGAAVVPAVVSQFEEKFGHYIFQGYGLTETNGPVIVVDPMTRARIDEKRKAMSIGKALAHVNAGVIGENDQFVGPNVEGEIVIAGASRFLRYWNKPEETEKSLLNDFLRTGDVGFVDEEGWFYIVDRKKDMINASGYKIWPREIEDVIYSHPSVREVVVLGVPDGYRGETVKAFVSLKAGHHASADEIREYCKLHMAAYKYPRIIEFMHDLPKTLSGKILRRELRDISASTSRA